MAERWNAEQWPSAGRIVHVKTGLGECRPAVIVKTFGVGADVPVELFVFPSSVHDNPQHAVAWKRDEWHWPEYVGPQAEV